MSNQSNLLSKYEELKIMFNSLDMEITIEYPDISNIESFKDDISLYTTYNYVEFPLGFNLIKFLEVDHNKIDEIIDNYFNINIPDTSLKHQDNLESIVNGYNRLLKLHPYFVHLRYRLENRIKEYDKYSKLLLYDNSLENQEKLNKAIEDLRNPFISEDLYVSNSYINLLKECIEFIFFDDTYPEFKDLDPFQKFMIYDTVTFRSLGRRTLTQELSSISSYIDEQKEAEYLDLKLESSDDRIFLANKVKNVSSRYTTEYSASPYSALLFELITLISNDKPIRKCLNCNKYFVPLNLNEKYCNRKDSHGNSCEWNQSINSEYDFYRKVYNKFYPYKKRNKNSLQDYDYKLSLDDVYIIWEELASTKRDILTDFKIEDPLKYIELLDDYKEWLENSYLEIQRIVKGKEITAKESDMFEDGNRLEVMEWLENANDRRIK